MIFWAFLVFGTFLSFLGHFFQFLEILKLNQFHYEQKSVYIPLKSYVRDGKQAGFWNYSLRIVQALVHIWIVTFVVSLTLIFLHTDERWENFRSYLVENYGEWQTTLLYGLIISAICPIMSGMQLILLGIGLSIDQLKKWREIFGEIFFTSRFKMSPKICGEHFLSVICVRFGSAGFHQGKCMVLVKTWTSKM